jgi:hypothetical protein
MNEILFVYEVIAVRFHYQEELSSEGYEVITTGDC